MQERAEIERSTIKAQPSAVEPSEVEYAAMKPQPSELESELESLALRVREHIIRMAAGGGCFIKDVAALRGHIKKCLPEDKLAVKVLEAMEAKNMELLTSTDKDLDLLEGVYGKKKVAEGKRAAKKRR